MSWMCISGILGLVEAPCCTTFCYSSQFQLACLFIFTMLAPVTLSMSLSYCSSRIGISILLLS